MNRHFAINPQQTVLVLGGHGFIGSHIVQNLRSLGAQAIIGTRKNNVNTQEKQIALHKMETLKQWNEALEGVDVVVNAVGILRQRFNETYETVHHHAIANLAKACANKHLRLVHISALGLNNNAQSRFISSKLRGEEALKNSLANWAIVRPSLVDGAGGFGAKWFRRVAQWPIHIAPDNAHGLFAPIHVSDLGEAVAKIALKTVPENNSSVYELGGEHKVNMLEHLQRLRLSKTKPLRLTIPTWLARTVSHLLDGLHLTPYSFGHYELLKNNNYPASNRLSEVLERPAKIIAYDSHEEFAHHAEA